jgi:hypothetical protein
MAGQHNARAPGWPQKRASNNAEIERAAEPGYPVQRATALGAPAAPDVGDTLTQGRLIHPQQPKDLTLAVARQNQQRCGAELWREPFHEPHRDLRTLAGGGVHQGGALLAGPPANGSTRIEQGAPAKCTDEPPAVGRAGKVAPAGLNRRKPDRLKEVLCFRPPTGGSLSLSQELGEYAWRHVALRIHRGSLSFWVVCARTRVHSTDGRDGSRRFVAGSPSIEQAHRKDASRGTEGEAHPQGHLSFLAVSGNDKSLWRFFNEVRWLWFKSLRSFVAAGGCGLSVTAMRGFTSAYRSKFPSVACWIGKIWDRMARLAPRAWPKHMMMDCIEHATVPNE